MQPGSIEEFIDLRIHVLKAIDQANASLRASGLPGFSFEQVLINGPYTSVTIRTSDSYGRTRFFIGNAKFNPNDPFFSPEIGVKLAFRRAVSQLSSTMKFEREQQILAMQRENRRQWEALRAEAVHA